MQFTTTQTPTLIIPSKKDFLSNIETASNQKSFYSQPANSFSNVIYANFTSKGDWESFSNELEFE